MGMTWTDELEAESPVSAAPARVRFGPGKDQEIPAAWAEYILTKLAAQAPAKFRKLLGEAATGQS